MQIDITYYGVAPLPFLTSKELFCTCVAKKFSLTSRVRNMQSLYFIWAGLTLSYYLCLGVSIHRGQTNSSAWVLCISCLIYIVKILLHQVTNIFITLHGYHLCVSVYVCLVRILKIYSLGKYQVYNTVLLTIDTMDVHQLQTISSSYK